MTSARQIFLRKGGTLSRPLDAARLKVLAWRAVLENVYPPGIGERAEVATYTMPPARFPLLCHNNHKGRSPRQVRDVDDPSRQYVSASEAAEELSLNEDSVRQCCARRARGHDARVGRIRLEWAR